MILPNSKIIHCTRNPKDNCLSIFKTYFTNSSLNFAYDLDELSMYYNLYNDLMKHWVDTLPNFIIKINYENVVKKPEEEIRRILKACNLEWNDNCNHNLKLQNFLYHVHLMYRYLQHFELEKKQNFCHELIFLSF